jgi:hypothetical protein
MRREETVEIIIKDDLKPGNPVSIPEFVMATIPAEKCAPEPVQHAAWCIHWAVPESHPEARETLIALFRGTYTYRERKDLESIDLGNLRLERTPLIVYAESAQSSEEDALIVEIFNTLSKIQSLFAANKQSSAALEEARDQFWEDWKGKNPHPKKLKDILTQLEERLRNLPNVAAPDSPTRAILSINQVREDIALAIIIKKEGKEEKRKAITFSTVFLALFLFLITGNYFYKLDQEEKERQAQEVRKRESIYRAVKEKVKLFPAIQTLLRSSAQNKDTKRVIEQSGDVLVFIGNKGGGWKPLPIFIGREGLDSTLSEEMETLADAIDAPGRALEETTSLSYKDTLGMLSATFWNTETPCGFFTRDIPQGFLEDRVEETAKTVTYFVIIRNEIHLFADHKELGIGHFTITITSEGLIARVYNYKDKIVKATSAEWNELDPLEPVQNLDQLGVRGNVKIALTYGAIFYQHALMDLISPSNTDKLNEKE